ncbi:MAG: permease, partial [Opitutales bacterium]|nr:permease [Opitutales bacterium]
MDKRREFKIAFFLAAVFAGFYFLPVGQARFDGAVTEALELTRWYAREHVILCLLPAFWIAGAIGAFVSQTSVMRYLGPKANKLMAYGVASVSGTILAVCSCTVLPLFAGIYRMGAGLGPATAFLYSGPAINALAIILTARILGMPLGLGRAVGAILFSVIIGLIMAFLFRREEQNKQASVAAMPEDNEGRPLRVTAVFFATMLGILIFANWGGGDSGSGFFSAVYSIKWYLTAGFAVLFAVELWRWYAIHPARILVVAVLTAVTALTLPTIPSVSFLVGTLGLVWLTAGRSDEAGDWFDQSWSFAKQILPLLLGGVLVAGLLLGRPGHEGLIPSDWINSAVGGNSIGANLFASVAGAFMYFATL